MAGCSWCSSAPCGTLLDLSEGSILGRLLHTLIGYTERPTELQLVAISARCSRWAF